MPAKIDLTVIEGATFEQGFRWMTGNPAAAVDLTGYSGVMHIRESIDSAVALFTLTSENGGVVICDQATNKGEYKISITDEATQGVCPDHAKRKCVYDLFLIDGTQPTAKARMQQHGTVTFEPAVTRTWTV